MSKRKSALIVDGDEAVLFFYKSFLEENNVGFDRFFISDPQKALELMNEREFDILAVNFKMKYSYFDGIDVALRFREKNPDALVLVISGAIWEAEQEATRKNLTERVLFVGKPISFDELSHKIEDLLGIAPW